MNIEHTFFCKEVSNKYWKYVLWTLGWHWISTCNAIVLHKLAKENKPQRRILIRKTGILMLASYFLKITTRDFHEISRYLWVIITISKIQVHCSFNFLKRYDLRTIWPYIKGVFSKSSGDYIVVPNFCLLS